MKSTLFLSIKYLSSDTRFLFIRRWWHLRPDAFEYVYLVAFARVAIAQDTYSYYSWLKMRTNKLISNPKKILMIHIQLSWMQKKNKNK